MNFEFITFTIRISKFKIYKLRQAEKNSSMSVVATAVSYRQRVGVGSESNSRSLRILAPHSDDTIAADMSVYFVRMQPLQVADNHIVSKLLAACRLRMFM